jgi:hypothetical protein
LTIPWSCRVDSSDGESTWERHGCLPRSTSTAPSGVGTRSFFFLQLMTELWSSSYGSVTDATRDLQVFWDDRMYQIVFGICLTWFLDLMSKTSQIWELLLFWLAVDLRITHRLCILGNVEYAPRHRLPSPVGLWTFAPRFRSGFGSLTRRIGTTPRRKGR